jgi:hypothetical protein
VLKGDVILSPSLLIPHSFAIFYLFFLLSSLLFAFPIPSLHAAIFFTQCIFTSHEFYLLVHLFLLLCHIPFPFLSFPFTNRISLPFTFCIFFTSKYYINVILKHFWPFDYYRCHYHTNNGAAIERYPISIKAYVRTEAQIQLLVASVQNRFERSAALLFQFNLGRKPLTIHSVRW